MTKQEQKDVALEDYNAIVDPACRAYDAIEKSAYKNLNTIRNTALEAYYAELKRIEREEPPEEIPIFKGTREALNNL